MSLAPTINVAPMGNAEFLRLMASFHAAPLDPAALMDRLGLTEHAKTPYRRLSGGQQQRLSLAAALVGRPELVLLDEPTAAAERPLSQPSAGDR